MTDLILDTAFHGDPAGITAVAAEAEARGVGGLFVAETSHDPYVALALAATATDRIQIGSSVAIAFARTPMTTAVSAWDVQRLSAGRLILGLGTQIKPHITRRYSMPWSSPAARMTEYVEALRAIWASWQNDTPLDFKGDYYEHTLMPPLFNPGPIDDGPPPIWLAAVGPRMLAAAGSVADGLICHPLLSRGYLDDVVVPTVTEARAAGEHWRRAVHDLNALHGCHGSDRRRTGGGSGRRAAADRLLRVDARLPSGA